MSSILAQRSTRIVLGAFAAYSVLYWVPFSPLPEKMPWGVIAQGVIFGTSYALLAMGLILIYRTTRIVNFAYGAMGAMPGTLTVALFVAQGWNYWLSIFVGVAVGTATGALVDILVIRRFARSSRLVLTVATIGLAQILGAIALVITIALGADILIGNIETPLSFSRFVRPYPVRGDHLLMVGVAPVVLAALGWFLLRTDAGTAVRAAAENQDRALLLGVPVRRLQTIVWAIAGGLSTLTFITKAPFTGIVPEALVGATAILPGLAVAVIARFKSLPAALVGGIGLGIAEWTIRWNVQAESIFDVTFLVVILGALLLGKDRLSRAETGESTWDSAGVLRPIPAELKPLPEVRRPLIGLAAVGALVAIFVPLQASPTTVVLAQLRGDLGAHRRVAGRAHGMGRQHQPRAVRRRRCGRNGGRQPHDPLEHGLLRRRRLRRAHGCGHRGAHRAPGAAHPRPVPGGHDARVRGGPRLVLPQPGQLLELRARFDLPPVVVGPLRHEQRVGDLLLLPGDAGRGDDGRARHPPLACREGDDRHARQRTCR